MAQGSSFWGRTARFVAIAAGLALFGGLQPAALGQGGGASLPMAAPFAMVRNVAVIPFQWQGERPESYRWQEIYQQLDRDFYSAVKASDRFRLINPGVSDDLWSTADGRRTLAERYELQGYLNLTATEKAGGVKLVARLLTPTLGNVFLESSTIATRTMLAFTPEQLRERITDLTFRLINRFPLDARVTSVQGKFVTLSAGRNLGIGSKEKFPVYRATVTAIHPATGGPASFERKQMGWVEIVDSRQFTSIARILRQNADGAIAIYDGIFIPTMTTRARFPERATVTPAPAPVIPLPVETPATATLPPKEPPAPPAPQQPEAPQPKERARVAPSSEPRPLMPIDVGLGIYSFSAGSPAKTASKFPITLLNSLRVGTRMATDQATQWELDLGYATGDTKNGSYSMIDFAVAGTLHTVQALPGLGFFPNHYWGAFVGYRSLGVSGRELFGGFDVLSVGGTAGVYSNYRQLNPDFIARASIDLKLAPLGFGQVGLAGEKQQLGSYLGLMATGKFLAQTRHNKAVWFGPRLDLSWQSLGAKGTSQSLLSWRLAAMAVMAL